LNKKGTKVMSIAGYFGRRVPELRTRRKLRDELGIQSEGAVLAGEKSLGERQAEDAATAGRNDGEYSGSEDYDPVLKSHCRHP
jgi:hypothetical protein